MEDKTSDPPVWPQIEPQTTLHKPADQSNCCGCVMEERKSITADTNQYTNQFLFHGILAMEPDEQPAEQMSPPNSRTDEQPDGHFLPPAEQTRPDESQQPYTQDDCTPFSEDDPQGPRGMQDAALMPGASEAQQRSQHFSLAPPPSPPRAYRGSGLCPAISTLSGTERPT